MYEISMIGRQTFGHLDLALKNSSPFGGLSLLISGDFLHLPPVNQKGVLMRQSKGSYGSFNECLWEKFQLHELLEIFQQSSDPYFAQLLNRVREGQQANNDMIQIKALANTTTTTWPDELVKIYLNNYLAGRENEDCIGKLDSEVVVIKTQDSNKDLEINLCSISIPDIIGISQSANLLAKLKLCVGARVMLTDNSVSDRLINSSIGTVKRIDGRSKLFCSPVYMKFDNAKVGSSLKDRMLHGELKEYIPITARANRFPLKKEALLLLLKENNFR